MLTWTGDRLVIMSKADGRFRTSAFDPSSNVWTLLPDAPIAPRRWTTVVHVPATRELFVWGGGDHDGGFGDGAALQLDTRTWRLLSPSPLTARYQPTVIASEDAVLVYGGGHVTSDATAFDDAAVWYPKSNSWKYLGKTSIGARRFAFGLRDGAQSFVIGGLSVADTTSAEPATFDFPSRTFTLHGATWSPFSTEAASPEWTAWTGGGLLFVYGPFTFEPFNSGAWFDPHTNKWTPLAPGGVSSRAFLSAVWTGTQAIVWGGCCDDAGRPFADGAIYTP
jgi:hypothetical protein